MNELLHNLFNLQMLQFGEAKDKHVEESKAKLRAKIPAPILAHYDRLTVRGKKAVALVRDQVCTGCHMRLPIGVVATLMRGTDIQVCDTCGRYLLLAEPAKVEVVETTPAPKPARKPRKAKRALHPA
ncbi:MAG TPA: C4-type zinc ribbon domain-containing protein [Verrucomicrobiae bacterium]|jgi:predicted  nucleic acid-binding Zn-ribbon protein|nr:C4-type zinc ribbon domain-containing protein [Verrucomicrobiae bacterium]